MSDVNWREAPVDDIPADISLRSHRRYGLNDGLNAHVDSIKFSGDVVAGLSLLSHSIMRLKPDEGNPSDDSPDEEIPVFDRGHIDLYLPPLSLYALTGDGRFRYSHELLPGQSTFTSPNGESVAVARDHRLSVIFRDTKPE